MAIHPRLLVHTVLGGASLLAALALAAPGCAPGRPKPARGRPPAPRSAVHFVDATKQAGIRFAATNSRTPMKYLVETMGSGCGFIDYDNDGDLDVVLLNGAPLPGSGLKTRPTQKLYRNDGNGRFTDVSEQAGIASTFYAMGCAVGDYNNDGWDDLYISGVLGSGRLYRNRGDGTFADVTRRSGTGNPGRWGTSCAWVDVDVDGDLDLFVANYVVYRSLADDIPCYAQRGQRTYCLPSAFSPSQCVLLRNDGGDRFTDISAQSGIAAEKGKSLGVAVWDYDRDGLPDIYVANDTTASFLFHNLGGSRFEELGVSSSLAFDEQGIPHSGMGIDVNDVHNHGRSTVVITNYTGQQTSFYNQLQPGAYRDDRIAAGIGLPSTRYLGFGAGFLDCDNDGWKDLLVVNGHVQDDIAQRQPNASYEEEPLLYRNLGNGTFTEIGPASGEPFGRKIVARGLAWGDWDNDGRVDALVTTSGGPAYLWRNETTPARRWLSIELQGTRSNRNGIGAMVTLRAAGLTQTTTVRSGSSYLSASDQRAHFGVGSAETAELEVRWPSGIVDRIPAVATSRRWKLVEGTGRLQ